MKTTLKIAKTELQVLFYSPVAWLILMIFTFQIGYLFAGSYAGMVQVQSMKIDLVNATESLFSSAWGGIYPKIQSYLYLYMPLLTMSIMSREYSSGSIKLLYSSPVTNSQIILGKYIALLLFGLVLTLLVSLLIIFTMGTLINADIGPMLTGLLGLFLLLSAYAAVGLFMSSLTSYNIVAAIGTLCVFAVMNFARGLWQDIPFVREITYWLAINGRADTFIAGMVTSEDVLYFLLVNILFVSYTIFRLQAIRKKQATGQNLLKFGGITLAVFLIGYLTTLPFVKFYYDSTYRKSNTLRPSSQAIMAKLQGGFKITTYVNMLDANSFIGLPSSYKSDVGSFEKYIRFKPEIQMEYVYYYHDTENPILDRQFPKLNAEQRIDTLRKFNKWKFDILPYAAIKNQVDLSTENYRFVRVLERENGRKTFLRVYDDMQRVPLESEISAAIKRLVMDELPIVGFVSGHGERNSNSTQDRGYKTITQEKTFRYSMINQGFDFKEIDLSRPVPENINILIIAEPRQPYSEQELANLHSYIASGRNMMLAGEPSQEAIFNQIAAPLGLTLEPGVLVKQQEALQPDLLTLKPTKAGEEFSYYLAPMNRREEVITMSGTAGILVSPASPFQSRVLFATDSSGTWNELENLNFIDGKPVVNPGAGEREGARPTVVALSRKVGAKQQKILVTGDADWISNSELFIKRNQVNASNFSLVSAAFSWLSDGEVPVDMRLPDPIDKTLRIGESTWTYFEILIKFIIPLTMLGTGIVIWIRRRGR
ncbi:Gldg family protein [Sphingobacterium thalpophilum]|uniref:ABC-type transport system involved in multi-copper enzyme maturation, permease component n=1 Tax=Sphingobacterium thalpophilum TaxID=259 RepID=A0A4U9VUG6_9SPHI|nr:Gldg family protein [Sphingobacterium thalpophilum]VTR49572.1 ABC-type transport system involved in multi-copper enzyme maturation, permease component [Sphingobacterium thalpophilum]